MSVTSSIISDAASELDPLFRSLDNAVPPCSVPTKPTSKPCSAEPVPNPPLTSFPLPPRRLRPGEIVNIPEPAPKANPTNLSPVNFYGVAIGGSHGIRPSTGIGGRAQTQTEGYTSLELRKMSLHNGVGPLPARPPPPVDGLRARNPSRVLGPSTPAQHPSLGQNITRLHRNLAPTGSVSPPGAQCFDSSSPTSSTAHPLRLRPATAPTCPPPRPPRTDSLLTFSAHMPPRPMPPRPPIARSRSTQADVSNSDLRAAHEALAGAVASTLQASSPPPAARINSDSTGAFPGSSELGHPYSVAPSSLVRKESNISLVSSDVPGETAGSYQSTASFTPPQSHADESDAHIKFAPLPNKPAPPFPSPASPVVTNTPELEAAYSKSSPKKKGPWKNRWLPPIHKASFYRPKPAISLPLADSLVVTGSGTSKISASASLVKRRRSVTEQLLHRKVGPLRPRSRSFSSVAPTVAMMASVAGRSPPLPMGIRAATAGKLILTGPGSISSADSAVSPTVVGTDTSHARQITATVASALDNASAGLPREMATGNQTLPSPSNGSSSAHGLPRLEKDSNTGLLGTDATECALPPASRATVVPPESPAAIDEAQVTSPAPRGNGEKKKREIRFRNTLELIPEDILSNLAKLSNDSPPPTATSSCTSPLSPKNNDYSKRKTPMKSRGVFQLRKNRTSLSGHNDDPFSGPSSTDPSDTNQPSPRGLALLPVTPRRSPKTAAKFSDAQDDDDEEECVNLLARKLAPKVNLTFVDLDHHIGSRFSVNTLFREVQKSFPSVEPPENLEEYSYPRRSSDSMVSETENLTLAPNLAHLNSHRKWDANGGPGRSMSLDADPVGRAEAQLNARAFQPTSEGPSEERDASSETLGSPTATTSDSNPTEVDPSPPLIEQEQSSMLEVVKMDGAEVMFQMVVPVSSVVKASTSSSESLARFPSQHQSWQRGDEEALALLSERLGRLNRSLEAQARAPEPAVASQGPGTFVPSQRKMARIENWLSTVPSPARSQHPLRKTSVASQMERSMSSPSLEDECPDSPIDRCAMPLKLARSGSKTKATLVYHDGTPARRPSESKLAPSPSIEALNSPSQRRRSPPTHTMNHRDLRKTMAKDPTFLAQQRSKAVEGDNSAVQQRSILPQPPRAVAGNSHV